MEHTDSQDAGTERTSDERRLQWDERHGAGDFEGAGPNPTLAAAVAGLTPGRALELACGSGTNAVWLATHGWTVTAVDWSPVALANGRAKAEAAGVEIDWVERNLFEWRPPERSFDLVVIAYLHLPVDERTPVYVAAAAAVARGARMIVVAHDRAHAAQDLPGPPPDRLFTAAELADSLVEADPGLVVERAETVRQAPPPERSPIDALLVLRRR